MVLSESVTIAISGLPCAGSSSGADGLAKRLDMMRFSAGDYFRMGSRMPNATDATLDIMKRLGSDLSVHRAINDMIIGLVMKGGYVIDGKLAVYLTRNMPNVFKIWVHAPFEVRAERSGIKSGIGFGEISEKMKLIEDYERRTFEKLCEYDYTKQKEFSDCSVDTSSGGLAATVGSMSDAFNSWRERSRVPIPV